MCTFLCILSLTGRLLKQTKTLGQIHSTCGLILGHLRSFKGRTGHWSQMPPSFYPVPAVPTLQVGTSTQQCRSPGSARCHLAQCWDSASRGPISPQHPPPWTWLGASHSPVMRTRAERQAKAGTSTTKLCRDREKARILSIQSPKPRAHCSRCSTRPEQKMSFPSPGLDLVEEVPTVRAQGEQK